MHRERMHPDRENHDRVYLAAPGFLAPLLEELRRRRETVLAVREDLVWARPVAAPEPHAPPADDPLSATASGRDQPGPSSMADEPAWAANVWYEPELIPAPSISAGARALRDRQRNWHLHAVGHHRRAALIADKLPHVSARPLVYGSPPPPAPLGSWTLWDERTILASARCASPFPDGAIRFAENRDDPPSRAYLKLWEVFTRLGVRPEPGELCVDLGAAPGGWTWALARHGARVLSVDKAPLHPAVEADPLVTVVRGSGFGLDPASLGRVDWLFSDMICYPSRLWTLVERWMRAGALNRAVCTLKFQGPTDHDIAEKFAAVPGSRLLHLSVNKHELTWVLL